MVQIAGKYEFVSQENYKEYLISLGSSEEQANKRAESKPSVTISPVEGGKITISYLSGDVTLTLNEEVEHVAGGQKVWITVVQNGDTLTLKTKFVEDGSVAEERVLKFTDTGLTETTVVQNGDTLTLKTKFVEDGSVAEEKVLKISDTGLTETSTNTKGVKTVIHYKRV